MGELGDSERDLSKEPDAAVLLLNSRRKGHADRVRVMSVKNHVKAFEPRRILHEVRPPRAQVLWDALPRFGGFIHMRISGKKSCPFHKFLLEKTLARNSSVSSGPAL
jgi:hypothetical protein